MFEEESSSFPPTMEETWFVIRVQKLVLMEWGAIRLEPRCRDLQTYITPDKKSSFVYFVEDTSNAV